jgi:thioredoxin reductase (NADPH)
MQLARARQHPKIHWELGAEVSELVTEKRGPRDVDSLVAVKLSTEKRLDVDGLFVAIGHTPNVQLFEDALQLDERGYAQTLGKSTRAMAKDGSWLEGLFLCGDVQDGVYRQAVTAAGTGCAAAIDAERWLASARLGR